MWHLKDISILRNAATYPPFFMWSQPRGKLRSFVRAERTSGFQRKLEETELEEYTVGAGGEK